MPRNTKSPEDWINFLLTLIDHAPDFKPDWEGFAQSTGTYKRGKFVQQAYNTLRKKYADGEFGTDNGSVPATPKAPGKKASGITRTPKTPQSTGSGAAKEVRGSATAPAGKKRKSVSSDAVDNGDEDDKDVEDKHAANVKKIRSSATKKKSPKVEDFDNVSEDELKLTTEGSDNSAIDDKVKQDNGDSDVAEVVQA